jgi:hypothetical protein
LSSTFFVKKITHRNFELSRREALALLGTIVFSGKARDLSWLPDFGISTRSYLSKREPITDSQLLDAIQQAIFQFFWEQASPATGLIKDRASARSKDNRTLSSIASTGFGLTALCLGDSHAYQPTAQIKARVATTLNFLLNRAPNKKGFFYHFMNMDTGERAENSEVSSIDTAILLCGALACRAYFQEPQIASLVTQLYDRVDWNWMLNGGQTFAHSWTPEESFCTNRWDTYSEMMMLYLLAIGSRTNPIPASSWRAWTRPILDYEGLRYITVKAPLFIHQFSHAWIDFRNRRDDFANYFENSVAATRAHKIFCLSLSNRFPDYGEKLWGISSSDCPCGYTAWGGPPAMGPIDGTVVPSAAAGSLPFLPADALVVLRHIYANFPDAWSRYGFVNAFNPLTKWHDPDVVGIGLGITALMLENLRTGLVWRTFMKNPEIGQAMTLAGFRFAE